MRAQHEPGPTKSGSTTDDTGGVAFSCATLMFSGHKEPRHGLQLCPNRESHLQGDRHIVAPPHRGLAPEPVHSELHRDDTVRGFIGVANSFNGLVDES